jgi:hypothetical protein
MNTSITHAGSHRLLSCLLVSLSLCSAAALRAQRAAPTAEQLGKYDTNKNGVLDADEVRAMDADTAKPPTPTLSSRDEVLQLSPFQVVADNFGYLASNTMSGTRLNAKIEDLGASISVITKEQLIDTAAIDINDVFQTEIGAEGTAQFTDQSVDFQGRVIDNVQASPYTANRMRGLSSANITTDGFTSTTRIPFDTYNLESIELSRGPNATLSGLGDAGGTVNVNQAKANLSRESSQVVFRGDDWGGYRTSLSLNRPIIKNKLAINVSALYDSKGFRRKPSADIQRRLYIALSYKPFAGTMINASFESFRQFRRTPNASTPVDMVSDWLAGGRPTWDPITSQAKLNGVVVGTSTNSNAENNFGVLPKGLGRDSFFDNFPSMFIEPNGSIGLYTPNRLQASGAFNLSALSGLRLMTTYSDVGKFRNATSGPAYPLDSLVGVSNREIYDYENINAVAPNWNNDRANLYQLRLEQRLLNSPLQQSYLQVAWRLEDSDNYNHNLLNETTNIYVDVNERLLDGTANPYFLRPYVNTIQRTASSNPIYNDTVRAQLSYTLNLQTVERPWLAMFGRHQALGYYELNRKRTANFQYRELVTSNVPWVNPANLFDGANTRHGTITSRFYLGDAIKAGSNNIIDYAPAQTGVTSGNYKFHYASNVAGSNITFTDTPVDVVEDGFGGATATRLKLKTYGGALQSFFLKDRLVTTVGYRKDVQSDRRTSGPVIDATTGLGTTSNLNTFGSWTDREGSTTTYQGVVRPFRGWGLFANAISQGGVSGYAAGMLDGFQLHYSHADSFRPTSPAVNLYGEALGNPHGVGNDYGFSIHTPDNKFVLRVNWYKSYAYAAPLVGQFALPVIIARDLETNPSFGLETFARNVITARPAFAGASEAQIQAAIYDFVKLPLGFYDSIRAPANVTDVNDQLSKGTEIELNYNPSRNLTFRFTATQTKAIDLTLVDSTARFIAERVPLWSTIANDAGQTWWSVSPLAGNLYRSQIVPNLLRMTANLGKARPQTKEWTWNALTNYRFTQGRFKGLSLGSTIRWADKSTIGYQGIKDPDGVVRTLDYTRPVYDPARASFDFMASYELRLFKDKIRTRVQLNCRDAFANRGLRATSWNPEGYPATFRILDGRQWVLSTTFDL